MPPPKNLFLIGYRGTGKTSVAHLLADHLGWRWVDADVLLEETHGKTIRQIFAEEGEVGFREKESAILRQICQQSQQVIATGGGVILRPENRKLLQMSGQVVWLMANPETIWQRLQQDHTTTERRPNLTQGGLQEIEELLRQRQPLYAECADFQVDTEDKTPEEIALAIFNWLKQPK